jgi:hypothetical protein
MTVRNIFSHAIFTVAAIATFLFVTPELNASNLAPSVETMTALLPGQRVEGTSFTSATRFDFYGEQGNWSYNRTSTNVGSLTQTYDEDGNDPDVYREVVTLTFLTATTGTYVYRQYDSKVLEYEQNGTFDFPWLAPAESPVWEPQGWVYFSWPYAYSFTEGRWHFFDISNTQWRVNLSNSQWGTLADATGWNYYAWPYSYSSDQSTWHWYDSNTQWVVDLVSGVWAQLGESD